MRMLPCQQANDLAALQIYLKLGDALPSDGHACSQDAIQQEGHELLHLTDHCFKAVAGDEEGVWGAQPLQFDLAQGAEVRDEVLPRRLGFFWRPAAGSLRRSVGR